MTQNATTPPSAAQNKKPDGPKITALKISTTGNVKRFCRAGLMFTNEPRVVKLADLKKKQIDALHAESRLRVEEISE